MANLVIATDIIGERKASVNDELAIHTHVKNIFLSSRTLIDAEKMPVHVFTIESKVRGYHVYKGIWNPSMDGRQSKKRKLSNMETESIIMGEELNDMHINLAVRLLTTQFQI